MKFNVIDQESWARKPYFDHYLTDLRCTYSMTANLDIGLLREALKEVGMKLYPALIYMITTVVNRHAEFRTCFDGEGKLGIWEQMSPSFTIFHEEDKTFSSTSISYSKDFSLLHNRYVAEMDKCAKQKPLFPNPNEPANSFPISSIPWVHFTGFNLNVYTDDTYLLPIFTIGKYNWHDDQLLLPLSVQLHHAVCDGYHAGVLFEELQQLAFDCRSWLSS